MTDPTITSAMHGVVEPFHAILYFVKEVQDRYEALGLEPRGQGYIAGRAAPAGPIGPQAAAAMFYNFNPQMFDYALPSAWEIASPAAVIEARSEGIEALYARVEAPLDGVEEATALAARAAAACSTVGRPLAAANSGVALPGTPFADLWQHLAVVREHRGDGHVALLTTEGLAPVEALVLYAGWQNKVSRRFLQKSRMWDDDAWTAAEDALRARGLLDVDGLTAQGRATRADIESRTDNLAGEPYEALGKQDTLRLFDLLVPLVEAMNAGQAFPREVVLPDRPS